MTPSFIAEYLDTALHIKEGETKTMHERVERERLTAAIAIARAAQDIPRRLGEDATETELAADKRTAKRIAYALDQCLKAWGGPVMLTMKKEEIQRQGAQVDWNVWWADQQAYINQRMRYVVTWQHKHAGDLRWTKSSVVRFRNELRWVQHALRSMTQGQKERDSSSNAQDNH